MVGEPTGRWAEIRAKTISEGKGVEPFEIAEGLVLYPPTPARSRAMNAATMATQAAIAAAANAVRTGAKKAETDEIQKQMEDCDRAYAEALLGGPDVLAQVEAYFADKGQWELDLLLDAVKTQFLQLPDDGICQHCGQVVDADAAGKGEGSSTTSTATGMSSRQTSPDTAEASAPATGATDDPGTNSST
ncbi:hypothetical protein ORI20_14075 [Mycobacterium sp. CVI_P3]|uniref:Uncharacterized protein n=1 Tax=Mycobacterium pinniadriaticum TaxID=2994102 RepID=A0ABT3SE94_9MYCO|nr:hypothetical protein [Mycobacterium pinniadriaticum]MCX2931408.1 hypothetical protein [Mycobacterium pinniadriaticum]MCX2937832.1 hypothetical protein [Mycobacterium pinniadriaticum]